MKKILRKTKGITLVALVVTIIVLLILAGISISIAVNGGIIGKAKNSTAKYKEAVANDTLMLNDIENYIVQKSPVPIIMNIEDATIELSDSTIKVGKTITAKITHKDNGNGIDITKCKYIYNTNENNIGTNEDIYTGGTFTTNDETINLNATSEGKYYLHILTVDNNSNKKETISSCVNVVPEKKYLYNRGQSTLGTLNFSKFGNGSGSSSYTQAQDYIELYAVGSTGTSTTVSMSSSEKIGDTSGYSKINIYYEVLSVSNLGSSGSVASRIYFYGDDDNHTTIPLNTGLNTITRDLNAQSSESRVGTTVRCDWSGMNLKVRIYEIYLS